MSDMMMNIDPSLPNYSPAITNLISKPTNNNNNPSPSTSHPNNQHPNQKTTTSSSSSSPLSSSSSPSSNNNKAQKDDSIRPKRQRSPSNSSTKQQKPPKSALRSNQTTANEPDQRSSSISTQTAPQPSVRRSNPQQNGQSKRKKTTTGDGPDNLSQQNRSIEPAQIAKAMALVQAKNQQENDLISPALLAGLGADSLDQANPSIQLSPADLELSKVIEAAITPLRLEISRLRSRIEILEDERLVTAREILSLKSFLRKSSESGEIAPIGRSSDLANVSATANDGNNLFALQAASSGSRPTSIVHRAPDIPVGPLSGPFGTVRGSPAASNLPITGLSPGQMETSPSLIGAKPESMSDEKLTPVQNRTFPIIPGASTPIESDTPFRQPSSRRKSENFLNSSGEPRSAASNRAKHRKPELSRTVRATVFRLMGVSSSNSPSVHNSSLPSESKFGSEKTRAYHGYTTTPCFPEYAENLYDPETDTKLWRWDWSKTIRQSANNTSFAKEIRHVIVKEAADPKRPMHTEVPSGDWQYLDDAIDSAYTNMRRERENLLDPNKMIKKEVHRARNKKRGLKEDKYKRRRRALDEYKADPKSNAARLKELNLDITDRPIARESELQNSSIEAESYRWDDCLDLKYMSSEDEANVNDFENPIPVGIDRPDSSLAVSDKVFAICRPAWRSQQLQNFFSVLDVIKQPERAYRRVMGGVRQSRPPVGTPVWMIKEDWIESEASTEAGEQNEKSTNI